MYAKPSKEWVIPPRPRPGRKLKKDTVPVLVDDDDDEAKKVQNRAAQRAFRERKQSQLADLQERIAQYERGEIERNVALQAAAKRLRDENEVLKKENAMLRARVESAQCASCGSGRKNLKRGAELDTRDLDAGNDAARGRANGSGSAKRLRSARAPSTVSSIASNDSSFLTSEASSSLIPPSSLSSTSTSYAAVGVSGDRRSSANATSPELTKIGQHALPIGASTAPNVRLRDADEDQQMNLAGFEIVDCGFCSEDTPCACRDAAAAVAASVGGGLSASAPAQPQQPQSGPILPPPTSELRSTGPARLTEVKLEAVSPVATTQPSIAPALPLRRNTKPKSGGSSVMDRWIVNPAPVAQASTSKLARTPTAHNDDGDDACTGDPANCPACADDPANQAFCAALGDAYSGGEENDDLASSATATPPPASSSRRAVHFADDDGDMMGMDGSSGQGAMPTPRLSVLALCCGDPKLCGGGCHGRAGDGVETLVPLSSFDDMDMDTVQPLASSSTARPPRPLSRTSSSSSSQRSREAKNKDMIPCNTAWAQLSSHPNIAFADLSLLADVVARRDHIHVDSGSSNAGSTRSAGATTSTPSMWPSLPVSPQDVKPSIGASMSMAPAHSAPVPGSTIAGSNRTLVPHDHLLLNGLGHRRRVRQVPNDGLQDALALLDGVRTLT